MAVHARRVCPIRTALGGRFDSDDAERDRFKRLCVGFVLFPVSVPPVPTPATNATMSPPVCSSSSSAVVSACASGIGRVFELATHPRVFRFGRDFKRFFDGPDHTERCLLSSTISAPYARRHVASLDAHVFRHDNDASVPTHRGDHGEADAGVATCRFDDG